MSLYRNALEVLKFMHPIQILRDTSCVCKNWEKASSADELWQGFIDDYDFPVSENQSRDLLKRESFHRLTVRYPKNCTILCSKGNIATFHCENETFSLPVPLRTSTIDRLSATTMLLNRLLFVCGGASAPRTAFTIDLSTGSSVSVQNMICPRAYHSIIYIEKRVFAFGGFKATAEMYSLQTQSWEQLSDMCAQRSLFNVCAHTDFIYLCGGNTSLCEAFNYQQRRYFPLPYLLPHNDWAVSFISGSELVVMVSSSFYIWDLEHPTDARVKGVQFIVTPCDVSSWGNMNPVVIGRKVYIPKFTYKQVLCVDMDSRKSRAFPLPIQ